MSFRINIQPLSIVVAVDEHAGFGKNGKIPWNIPEDMKHFQTVTKDSVCIMGRKTYEDMLEMRKSRDAKKGVESIIDHILPNRQSFVVTSNRELSTPGATPVANIVEAVQSLDETDTRTVFVLGGRRMFIEALPWTDTVHMTIIKGTFDCDIFFPVSTLIREFTITEGEETDKLRFVTYKRIQ